jgi:hypothetical protein
MNKLLGLGLMLIVFAGVATVAYAETFTTSSCNVDFAVNDGGSFYVRSSQIPGGAGSPPGVDASAAISGSSFHLTATAIQPAYSDSGIILYFNGGLKLGDLQSVSVISTGSPVTINLWFDTSGDGKFFAFDGNGIMTGLNGDSYGSSGAASLDANTSVEMFAGGGAGHTYTLAQLQAGAVSGITSNTDVALWIGITNPSTADISSVAVSAAGPLLSGGDRLAATQNTDGGWGWPLSGTSQQNTIGPIAMGLAKAYEHTGSASQLAALEKAGDFLLHKTNTFSPPDGYLAAELDRIFGGSAYRDHVKTNYYDMLAAGTYDKDGAGTLYDTADYITLIHNNRASQGIPNLAAWDLGMGLVAAASCGASTSEWIDGVKAEINELDGNLQYDVIGLAGALYGLAFVNEDFDPTAGEHAAASDLGDLAAILAGYQLSNGAFPDNKNGVDGSNQETAYAILALNEVDRSTYLDNIQNASNYLVSVQLASGGWNNESGGNPADENNEVTGEALWGISTVVSDNDADHDGTPDCHDLCPHDPLKIAPGVCGCGVADTDTDGDGTPDCNDLCPNDLNKTQPGQCGCGVADTDTDGDGTADCHDLCPHDPLKIAPGICGCGVADIDSDGDGVPNCHDLCPYDPLKTAPGVCGCGTADTDTDGDGTPDCNDLCPNDPSKTAPGTCGCGIPDTPCCGGSCNVRTDTPQYFPTIEGAYTNATNGTVIQARDLDFTENLIFNRNISVTLKGGYEATFTNNPSYTKVHGTMTISNGNIIVENVVIQ